MTTFFIAFAIFYVFHAQGITLGYHRLLSHKSLKVPKWLEYFVVSGGYLCLEGSPIFWVTTHRLHHRYSDHDGDPHAPKDGLFHAFVSWMWKPQVYISAKESRELAPDLYRDPVYRALHAGHTHWDGILCLFFAVAFRVAIYFLFGPVVLAANLLATFMSFLGPLLVNSVGHLRQFGYQTYDCNDDSRNVFLVAMLSMGEGWHNNHHAFPTSARHGLTWREPDPTWLTISILKLLGLAKEIRLPKNQSHFATARTRAEQTADMAKAESEMAAAGK
jgi:stearoyl-CoA desaturase (delta-9 desaturase)